MLLNPFPLMLSIDRIPRSRQREPVRNWAIIVNHQQHAKLVSAIGGELHPIGQNVFCRGPGRVRRSIVRQNSGQHGTVLGLNRCFERFESLRSSAQDRAAEAWSASTCPYRQQDGERYADRCWQQTIHRSHRSPVSLAGESATLRLSIGKPPAERRTFGSLGDGGFALVKFG